MKKTITVTEEQVCAVTVAIGMQITALNGLLQLERERGEENLAHMYERDIAALEQAKAAVRGAKWEY